MNLIHVAGHLGADPEERFTPNGQKIVILRVAARYRRGSKDETIWYRVTLWGDRFDRMLPYLKKGSAVIVIGELHPPEIYTNREGQPQVSLEVTAEMVRFSPFGRSERGGQAGVPSATRGESELAVLPSVPMGGGYEAVGAHPAEEDLPF